jgi:hypothetical protein
MRIIADTSDTVFSENAANNGNYRNLIQKIELLVTPTNADYYAASVGFIMTCGQRQQSNPSLSASSLENIYLVTPTDAAFA